MHSYAGSQKAKSSAVLRVQVTQTAKTLDGSAEVGWVGRLRSRFLVRRLVGPHPIYLSLARLWLGPLHAQEPTDPPDSEEVKRRLLESVTGAGARERTNRYGLLVPSSQYRLNLPAVVGRYSQAPPILRVVRAR